MGKTEIATLGGGCFWCIEAALNKVKGVISAVSGYSGGHRKNPSYQQIITGVTGHAEVVQITYDSSIISYEQILSMFFQLHDPTTLNQQGNDVGTQYRSVILHHDDIQKRIASRYIETLTENGVFENPITTELKAFETFYPAEEYHQGYAIKNPDQPYCTILIGPKLALFENKYRDWIK